MDNDFKTAASKPEPEKVWVAAFLNQYKQGWGLTGNVQRLQSPDQIVAKPPEHGMGVIGYQLYLLDAQELAAAGNSLNAQKQVTRYSEITGRSIFGEDDRGACYKFSGGNGDGKYYEGMAIHRIIEIEILAGDKIVDRFGQKMGDVVKPEKLSVAAPKLYASPALQIR